MTTSNNPEDKPKVVPTPISETITVLDQYEEIIQLMPLNNGATFACLTSSSRVLIPTSQHGEWTALPVPPLFSS